LVSFRFGWGRFFTALAALLLALSIFFSIQGAPVFGQDDEWEEIEERREEIEEMEATIKDLEERVRGQETRTREIAEELKETEQRLERAETELESAQESLEEKRGIFGGRVRSAYMNQGFSYLELLFSADNLGDLVLRLEYLSRIFQHEIRLVEEMRQEREKTRRYAEEIEEDRDKVAALYREEAEEGERLRQLREEEEKLLYQAKDELRERLAQISTRAEAPPVYGVVIDNFHYSRPQHALAAAQKVYEYEVEGNITRYLALYADFPTRVGPMRSARVHSATLAMENNVLLVYAGAASDVESILTQLGVNRVNALRGGSGFWRVPEEMAPYNLYVNLSTLGLVPPPDRSEIKPIRPAQIGNTGERISLVYNNFTSISYRYDSVDNLYTRYLNNSIHRDAQGNAIRPRNVIKQYVSFTRDGRGRPTANLVGSGRIDFYSNGEHFRGTWEKASPASPTNYYYEDGTPIEIPYGKTWIQIIAS